MNLELLEPYKQKRIEEQGFLGRGDIAKLLEVSKDTIKYYESINVLIPDKINEHGSKLYSKQTSEDFIKWYKQKPIFHQYPKREQKPESQDELEWKNYLKELHS